MRLKPSLNDGHNLTPSFAMLLTMLLEFPVFRLHSPVRSPSWMSALVFSGDCSSHTHSSFYYFNSIVITIERGVVL